MIADSPKKPPSSDHRNVFAAIPPATERITPSLRRTMPTWRPARKPRKAMTATMGSREMAAEMPQAAATAHHGAEAAAQHHFGRPALGLTLTQASRLAAVLPNPKTRVASRPSNYVKRRARQIAAGAQTLKADARDTCALK